MAQPYLIYNTITEDGEMNTEKIQAQVDALQVAIDEAGVDGVEVNADGDTIAVMQAVYERGGAIEVAQYPEYKNWMAFTKKSFGDMEWDGLSALRYRITAKHADTFDADCMDFET